MLQQNFSETKNENESRKNANIFTKVWHELNLNNV